MFTVFKKHFEKCFSCRYERNRTKYIYIYIYIYDFSLDYSSIDVSAIQDVHKYLMN